MHLVVYCPSWPFPICKNLQRSRLTCWGIVPGIKRDKVTVREIPQWLGNVRSRMDWASHLSMHREIAKSRSRYFKSHAFPFNVHHFLLETLSQSIATNRRYSQLHNQSSKDSHLQIGRISWAQWSMLGLNNYRPLGFHLLCCRNMLLPLPHHEPYHQGPPLGL
jgi:hypothetical protein